MREALVQESLWGNKIRDVVVVPEAGRGRRPVEIHQRDVLVGIVAVPEHFLVGDERGVLPAWMLLTHRLVAFHHDAQIRVRMIETALDARNQILERHRAGRVAELLEIGRENPHLTGVLQVVERLLAHVVVGLDPAKCANLGNVDGLIRGQITDGPHRGVHEDLEWAQDLAANIAGQDHVLDDGELLLHRALREALETCGLGDLLLGRHVGPHQLVRLGIEPRERFHRGVLDPRDVLERDAANRHPPEEFPRPGGLIELLVQGADELVDDIGLGDGLRVLLVGSGLEDRGDTAQAPHHLVEHLGSEIEDQMQLVGVAGAGEERPVARADPVLARDEGEIHQDTQFHRPGRAGLLRPETVVVGGELDKAFGITRH